MKMARLDRLYRELDSEERFRAWMAAVVAGDTRTADQIVAACPRVVVRMPEPGFDRLNRVILGLHAAFGLWASHWIGWLDALDLACEFIGETPDHEAGPTLRRIEVAERQVAAELVSLRAALVEVMRSVPGLDPDQYLRATASPVADGLDRHRGFLNSTEPIEELLAPYRAHFLEVLDAVGIPESDGK